MCCLFCIENCLAWSIEIIKKPLTEMLNLLGLPFVFLSRIVSNAAWQLHLQISLQNRLSRGLLVVNYVAKAPQRQWKFDSTCTSDYLQKIHRQVVIRTYIVYENTSKFNWLCNQQLIIYWFQPNISSIPFKPRGSKQQFISVIVYKQTRNNYCVRVWHFRV